MSKLQQVMTLISVFLKGNFSGVLTLNLSIRQGKIARCVYATEAQLSLKEKKEEEDAD